VLFYSFTGKTAEIAREVAKGAGTLPGVTAIVKRVPEILPQDFFEKKPALKSINQQLAQEFPEATLEDLVSADGVAFGTPVHFGSFASQMKQFIDQLSPVFIQGKLVNKPAAVFCSAGSTHGGEEATLLSLIVPLLNLGMVPVGIPYPIQGEGAEFDAGSPYGAIAVSGHKGEKTMNEGERKIARILGKRLATMAQILTCECEHCQRYRSLIAQES